MERLLFYFGLGLSLSLPALAQPIRLTLDTSEADASLAVLEKESARGLPSSADWDAIFATTPYRLLQKREAAFNNTRFDEALRAYLTSPDAIARTADLRATLHSWQQTNLEAAAEHVLYYLPEGARIWAQVYPV